MKELEESAEKEEMENEERGRLREIKGKIWEDKNRKEK